MEMLIGFLVGYVVGSKNGQEGLARVISSGQEVINSEEVRNLASTAAETIKGIVGGALAERENLIGQIVGMASSVVGEAARRAIGSEAA
jgi:hypothetical protein